MNSYNYLSNMISDDLSVEAISDGCLFPLEVFDPTDDVDISSLFNSDLFETEIDTGDVCVSADLVESINHPVEANEFDKYLGPKRLSSSALDIDQNLLVVNSLPVYGTAKAKMGKSNKKPILLSSSVGVGVPQRWLKPAPLFEIVYELEEKYRPRYKSDYFAQNGTNRKPRYVTDRLGSHYVTLKIPRGIQGQIRIDWLTVPNASNQRYSMPYRFQANNDSTDVADCNPIYQDIVPDVSGTTMRVYLVLIKAKQDALKSLQPLQPFHPVQDAFGITDKQTPGKTSKLTPKKLIQEYQLGKSQLAFTLCTLGIDGRSRIPQWDTTVYSTVLEEESGDGLTRKIVTCPNCASSIPVSDEGVVIQEPTIRKRKNVPIEPVKPKIVKKQRSLPETVYGLN